MVLRAGPRPQGVADVRSQQCRPVAFAGGTGTVPCMGGMYPGRLDAKYEGGMRLARNYLQRQGYRLPTEAEMEYATRAGAVTARYYGETAELLPKYAWYNKNAQEKTWPVGSLKPNDLGLFDAQGNVWTWCSNRSSGIAALGIKERFKAYAEGNKETDHTEDDLLIKSTEPVCCVAVISRLLRRSSALPSTTPMCRRTGTSLSVSVRRGLLRLDRFSVIPCF